MNPRKQKDHYHGGNPADVQRKRVSKRSTRSTLKCTTSNSPLGREESESVRFSFELGILLLQRDQPCSQSSLDAFGRLLTNVLSTGDVLGFIEACSAIRRELVLSGSWAGGISKCPGLRWVKGIRAAIEHAVDCNLVTHPSSQFDAIVTFLGWLKRLPVCIRPIEESIQAYKDCDTRISSIDFEENEYVPRLREIWREWFGKFRLTAPFSPKHGSGSTADAGRIRHDKWRKLSTDRRAHVCLRTSDLHFGTVAPIGNASRAAKVVMVPKQAGKDRTICMEPAWLQYLQQGVARQLIHFTHHDHALQHMVDIFSQERNRSLCARAYQDRLCTIDLSDASDSVSWRLMRQLTKGLPLERYLFATRSTSSVVYGEELQMDKFAPMGSALCFPIECYVFASVVELAYRIHYGQASYGHHSGCSVYGDDIICPAEIYHLVVSILTSLGFLVNEAKSFSSGPYYESCGVEYLYGVMIRTIKHPRNHLVCNQAVSPERIGLITDLANSLGLAGYFQARRHLLCQYKGAVVRIGSRDVPFMDLMVFDRKHCIPIQAPYYKGVWSAMLHTSVRRFWSIETRLSQTQSDYIEWLHQCKNPDREERIHFHRRTPVIREVDAKWSRKAVVFLSKTHQWELLKEGDIREIGQHRAGRPRQRLRSKTQSLWSTEVN